MNPTREDTAIAHCAQEGDNVAVSGKVYGVKPLRPASPSDPVIVAEPCQGVPAHCHQASLLFCIRVHTVHMVVRFSTSCC
jgi:hypothetical protein